MERAVKVEIKQFPMDNTSENWLCLIDISGYEISVNIGKDNDKIKELAKLLKDIVYLGPCIKISTSLEKINE